MEYKINMQTVVETPSYLAVAGKLFDEDEREEIVAMVAVDPECGEVMAGTGGFRKVRVARAGMGKRGGTRVVYIWRNSRFPVFLITVFPKNEKANLSNAERNALKKRADGIFGAYRR
jgi:hypothetical protein